MITTLGSICASLLGVHRWVPNDNHMMTMVEWQGGPQESWIPHNKPLTAVYEPHHISNEIILFLGALAIGVWGFRNRNHKVDGTFARIALGLSVVALLYFPMLWLARHHVEGDWTAVPPRLMHYQVETPEFLAKEAAMKAEWEALELKRTGLTQEQRNAQWERLSSKCMAIFVLFTIICAVGQTQATA